MAQRTRTIISTIPAALAFWLVALGPAGAQPIQLYATPDGAISGPCSQVLPCTPQAAASACPGGQTCTVHLAYGLYLDPAVDVSHFRFISFVGPIAPSGVCQMPQNTVLRATQPNTNIFVFQDHVTGTVGCLTMEATAAGVNGIVTRQHVIVDYENVMCGPLPSGTCLALAELTIGTCAGQNWLSGDVGYFTIVSDFSKLNLACDTQFTTHRTFNYFAVVADFSTIHAQTATFSGAGAIGNSIGCVMSNSAIVYKPPQGFPGSSPGNC